MMKQMLEPGLPIRMLLLLFSLFLLTGCGGGSARISNIEEIGNIGVTRVVGLNTRGLVVTEPNPITRGQDRVDSLSALGFDAGGNVVYGPVVVDFGATMLFPNLPDTVASVQLDYLRFHGYPLFRWSGGTQSGGATGSWTGNQVTLTLAVDGSLRLDDPDEQPVAPPRVAWKVQSLADGGFQVQVTPSGALPPTMSQAPSVVRIKGVCYSPTPINGSSQDAPNLGDLFWDAFSGLNLDGTSYAISNWCGLWGDLQLTDAYRARGDLDRIRSLGANTIRVYSMLSRQLDSDNQAFPSPPAGRHFSHKQFLDMCWNNGNNPLYVVVDIPMPTASFQDWVAEDKPGQIAWWEAVLAETVADLKDHPAVIGFNIMNEQDNARAAYPGNGQGPATANTDYFYGNCSRYADLVKGTAPDKLVGWALHDEPNFVIFASAVRSSDPALVGRGVYMDWLSSFDYWGLNTRQTLSFASIVAPGFPLSGSYANLTGSRRKPVFLTELGWPASGRDAESVPVDNAQTQTRTALTISRMVPQVYTNSLFMGACYFEFSDEWWRKLGSPNSTWDPGAPQLDLPNGYLDLEGFGLFAVGRSGGRPHADANWGASGPILPHDQLFSRLPMISALKQAWSSVTNP